MEKKNFKKIETVGLFLIAVSILALFGLVTFCFIIAEVKQLKGEALRMFMDERLQPWLGITLAGAMILGYAGIFITSWAERGRNLPQ